MQELQKKINSKKICTFLNVLKKSAQMEIFGLKKKRCLGKNGA